MIDEFAIIYKKQFLKKFFYFVADDDLDDRKVFYKIKTCFYFLLIFYLPSFYEGIHDERILNFNWPRALGQEKLFQSSLSVKMIKLSYMAFSISINLASRFEAPSTILGNFSHGWACPNTPLLKVDLYFFHSWRSTFLSKTQTLIDVLWRYCLSKNFFIWLATKNIKITEPY